MNRWTSVALTGLVAMGLCAAAWAHDPEMEARYRLEEKLGKPWVTKNGFTADFDKALETAVRTKKPVFAYFTLSYTDDPACQKVESGVLSTPEFKKFGESVVLFTHIESGLQGKYAGLLREKGGIGVPYFLVLDDQGNVTAKVTEGIDVKGFEQAVKAAGEFAALRQKTDKTADEKVFVLTHEMDLGNLKLELAKDRVAALGNVSEAQKTQIDDAMMRLSITTAAAYDSGSRDRSLAAGKSFAEMWAAGREPKADELVGPFFIFILGHAEEVKDATLFERALEKLKGRFGDKVGDRDWKDFFEAQAERLETLEASRASAGGEKNGNGAK